MLYEDLDVVQPRLLKILSQDGQTALPRPQLGRSSSTAGVEEHLFGDPESELLIKRQHDETSAGLAEQRHGWNPPGSTNQGRAGGGVSCER